MMLYLLAYFELLILSIVGLGVYISNQTIHGYVCKLIGGNEVLIVRVDSDLLFLDVVVIYTTIGVGCLLSMGSRTPKLLRYSGRSKPRMTERRVPCRRQTAKWVKRNSQSIGKQQA